MIKLLFKRVPMPDDLTRPDMIKSVFNIAWPALVELFLVQLCSMVDTMMAGQMIDSWAIAAIGYCTQPKFMLLAVFVALNSGATALIARFKGADEKHNANLVFRQCIMISLYLSIILSVIGFLISKPMVVFMGAKEEITIQAATEYMQIQMIGFTFNALTLATTAALRGVGSTKFSMVYNLTANIVNVIFNYLLIGGNFGFPKLGVAGASIATVIGQVVAFVMVFYIIISNRSYLSLDLKKLLVPDFSIIKRMLRIGFPAMIEQIVMRTGMLIYILTVSSLSTQLFSTHQIASSILTMSFNNGQAFGIAATSLLGQSMGKKRPDMAKAYTMQCRRIGMYVALGLAVIFFFGGEYLTMLYTNDKFIIAEAGRILKVVAFLQPLQASQLIISGALRGAGDTKLTATITFIGILIVRPIASLILVQYVGLGLMGAWIAMCLDQTTRSVFSLIRFNMDKWITLRV